MRLTESLEEIDARMNVVAQGCLKEGNCNDEGITSVPVYTNDGLLKPGPTLYPPESPCNVD